MVVHPDGRAAGELDRRREQRRQQRHSEGHGDGKTSARTSLAYARTKAAFADVIIKSELKDHGYYYAQGIAYDGAVELESGDFRLAFGGRGGTYWSFDFADTNQNRIQNNFSLRDTRLFLRTAASLQPCGGPVRIAIELDDDVRESSIPGAAFSFVEQRLLVSALLVF